LKQGASAPEWATVPTDSDAATPSLRTLGTGAAQACAGNDSRLGAITDAYVSQSKLKTSYGEVSIYSEGTAVLPGGEYGFVPMFKKGASGSTSEISFYTNSATYSSMIKVFDDTGGNKYTYCKQRYVTSSGEVNWLFVLRGKKTKQLIASWYSPDHPCMGNGGNPELVPHPFPACDFKTQEIVCVNPSEAEIASMKTSGRSILEVINNDYAINDRAVCEWPTKQVTIGLPEDHDWKMGTNIKPIKMKIPRPENILCRELMKIEHVGRRL
jgi:hypothetical protein